MGKGVKMENNTKNRQKINFQKSQDIVGFAKPKTQPMEFSAKSAKKIYNILRPEKFFKKTFF